MVLLVHSLFGVTTLVLLVHSSLSDYHLQVEKLCLQHTPSLGGEAACVSVIAGHSLSASSDTGLHQALQTTDGEAKLHLQVQADVQVRVMAGGGGGMISLRQVHGTFLSSPSVLPQTLTHHQV